MLLMKTPSKNAKQVCFMLEFFPITFQVDYLYKLIA